METEQLLETAESTERLLRDYLPDLKAPYELGRWTETGKLAARSGNRCLLTSRSFRRTLSEHRREEWGEEVNEALEMISKMTSPSTQEFDPSLLDEVFEALIRES